MLLRNEVEGRETLKKAVITEISPLKDRVSSATESGVQPAHVPVRVCEAASAVELTWAALCQFISSDVPIS